jgi:hypothetical protein
MKPRILNLFAALAVFATITPLSAQVPNLVSHQGRVAVNGVNFNGTGKFKFALVDTTGSTSYWSNDGTSNAGSEPVVSVSLPVTMGLYSVLLGDTVLPLDPPSTSTMAEMPASVFQNNDVRLRVWFNDGINGFQKLTPDQRLAPNGYLPDGAVSNNKLAAGAVGAANLAPGAVWKLDAPDGSPTGAVQVDNNGNLTFTGTIAGNGAGLTSINAANLTGSVPGATLTSVPSTSLTGIISEARLPAMVARTNVSNNFIGPQFVNGGFNASGTAVLGAVGIGTNSPARPLQVGNASVEGSLGMMRFASRGSGITASWARYWDVGVPVSSTDITGRNLSFIVDDPQLGNDPELMIDWFTGDVGIGVPYPEADLHLYSESNPTILRIQSGGTPGRGRVEFWSNPTDDINEWRPGYIESTDSGNFTGVMRFVVNGTGNKAGSLETMRLVNGKVGIRTIPTYELDVNGNAYVSGQIISGTAMFAPAFNTTSDRDVKENFESIDPREMLEKVVDLPLSRWNFKNDPNVEHIGPMAQDFHAAFATGTDDKHIATVDADGVALAAIQGLNAKLEEKDHKINELEDRLAALEEMIGRLPATKTESNRTTETP